MRRAIAFSLLLLTPLSGCHSWAGTRHLPPARPGVDRPIEKLRVLRTDGTLLVLHDARVREDSVFGYERPPRESASARPVGMALEDIEGFELRRFSTGKTALAVLGGVAGLFALSALICAASDCFDLGEWDLFGDPATR